ncbi:MAG TPA: membrane protein insertase YidC, partial [Alphaproteobacteria bacterium]
MNYPNPNLNPNGPGKMHPDDKRNMIVFFAMCALLFFAYDFFVGKPHKEALKAQQAQMQAAQKAQQTPEADLAPLTREDALAKSPRIKIDNPDLQGSINLRGGRIDDLKLKTYFETIDETTPVTLLTPARAPHAMYADFGWLPAPGQTASLPGNDTVWQAQDNLATLSVGTPVTLTWNNGQGLSFERTYALDEHYMFTITQKVTNHGREAVSLHPYALLSRQGLPADFAPIAVLHEGPIGLFEDGLEEVTYKDLDKEPRHSFSAEQGWAGFTDKYWFYGIIAADESGPENYRFLRSQNAQAEPIYQVDMTGAPLTIAPGATATNVVRSFQGPKKLGLLNDYAKQDKIDRFDLVIDFGKFWFLTIPFFHALTWMGHTFGSFAIALLALTCLLRLAVFPLANKSYRSFARMRKIQPQMAEIREKYGDDRAKLQQEIFNLYKKEQVNPMAGCLPILIQIPIFFSLYKVLYISIDMRHAPFWGWIQDMSAPDPTSVFSLFGLIPFDLPQFITIGIWPIIMGIT